MCRADGAIVCGSAVVYLKRFPLARASASRRWRLSAAAQSVVYLGSFGPGWYAYADGACVCGNAIGCVQGPSAQAELCVAPMSRLCLRRRNLVVYLGLRPRLKYAYAPMALMCGGSQSVSH